MPGGVYQDHAESPCPKREWPGAQQPDMVISAADYDGEKMTLEEPQSDEKTAKTTGEQADDVQIDNFLQSGACSRGFMLVHSSLGIITGLNPTTLCPILYMSRNILPRCHMMP